MGREAFRRLRLWLTEGRPMYRGRPAIAPPNPRPIPPRLTPHPHPSLYVGEHGPEVENYRTPTHLIGFPHETP